MEHAPKADAQALSIILQRHLVRTDRGGVTHWKLIVNNTLLDGFGTRDRPGHAGSALVEFMQTQGCGVSAIRFNKVKLREDGWASEQLLRAIILNTTLNSIEIKNCDFDNDFVMLLVGALANKGKAIDSIDVTESRIERFQVLKPLLTVRSIRRLALRSQLIKGAGSIIGEILERKDCGLKILELRNFNVGAYFSAVCAAFRKNTSVAKLILRDGVLTRAAARNMAELMNANPAFESLTMENVETESNNERIVFIDALLASTRLHHLDLSNSPSFGKILVSKIHRGCGVLKNLEELVLGNCYLQSEEFEHLLDVFAEGGKLCRFDLSRNKIVHVKADKLLRIETLRTLLLEGNSMQSGSCDSLATLIAHSRIQELSFSCPSMTEAQSTPIVAAISQKTNMRILKIDVKDTPLQEVQVKGFVNALHKNIGIVHFALVDRGETTHATRFTIHEELAHAMTRNITLFDFEIDSRYIDWPSVKDTKLIRQRLRKNLLTGSVSVVEALSGVAQRLKFQEPGSLRVGATLHKALTPVAKVIGYGATEKVRELLLALRPHLA